MGNLLVAGAALLAWALAGHALAAPGSLDPAFGRGGLVQTRLPNAENSAQAVARQADGKLLVAGYAQLAWREYPVVQRFNADGSLDAGFGEAGTATLSFPSTFGSRATALAVQADGRILVGGSGGFHVARLLADGRLDTSFAGTGYVFRPTAILWGARLAILPDGRILATSVERASDGLDGVGLTRYNPDGTRDASFGSGGTTVLRRSDVGTPYVSAIALQGNGALVAAGSSDDDQFGRIWRYTPTGALDTGFAGGAATLSLGDRYTLLDDVAVLPDGRVIVVGAAGPHSLAYRAIVARFRADGTPDPAFNGTGSVQVGSGVSDRVSAVQLRTDGSVLAVGRTWPGSGNGNEKVLLARLRADGTRETAFGTAGTIAWTAPGRDCWGASVADLGADRFAVAGQCSGPVDAVVAAFRADGSADPAFASTGFRLADAGSVGGSGRALAVQPDGKVLVGAWLGTSTIGSEGAVIARYLPGGSLDPAFGSGGIVQAGRVVTALALQPDGRILAAGYARFDPPTTGEDFTVMRLLADGRTDASFGQGGFAVVPVTATTDRAAALALQPDGKIVVGGTAGDGDSAFAIVRLLANGALDTAFASGGIASLQLTSGVDTLSSLALLADGRIVAAGTANGQAAVARLLPGGAPDSSLAGTGRAIVASSTMRSANALGIAPDGGLYLAGSGMEGAIEVFAVAKLRADGSLDSAFGTGGLASARYAMGGAAQALAVTPRGRVLVAGYIGTRDGSGGQDTSIALAQFLPTGAPDTSFGGAGQVVTNASARDDHAFALALLGNGNFVVAGAVESLLGLARYEGSGALIRNTRIDFDDDGRGDLVWRNADGRVAIWLMDGLAPTATAQILGPGTGWSVTHLADLSGDHRSDVVWRHADGRAAVYLMDGFVPFESRQILDAGSGWTITHAADLDGDRKADLVFRHDTGAVAVWLMNGTNVASGAGILAPGTGWTLALTADFDADGKEDLLWRHDDGRHAVWLMDGLAVKASAQILDGGSGWIATHAADLDGDGRADILWRHGDGRIAAWRMNGTAMAAGSTLMAAGSGWRVTNTADFDGDGKADLLWLHDDGRVAAWLMNGLAPAASASLLNAGSGWSAVRTEDLDLDGRSDIVWQHADGRTAAWLMNGTAMRAGTELLGGGGAWNVTRVSP